MGLIITDSEYLPAAKSLLEQAEKSIDIATFKLEDNDKPRGRKIKEFWQLLIEKAKNGIKVRLLMNWHDDKRSVARTNQAISTKLKQHQIPVRFLRNNRCCHAKILLADKKKALIGSHNLSIRSCQANFEISYLLSVPEEIANLSSTYEHSWQDAQIF